MYENDCHAPRRLVLSCLVGILTTVSRHDLFAQLVHIIYVHVSNCLWKEDMAISHGYVYGMGTSMGRQGFLFVCLEPVASPIKVEWMPGLNSNTFLNMNVLHRHLHFMYNIGKDPCKFKPFQASRKRTGTLHDSSACDPVECLDSHDCRKLHAKEDVFDPLDGSSILPGVWPAGA